MVWTIAGQTVECIMQCSNVGCLACLPCRTLRIFSSQVCPAMQQTFAFTVTLNSPFPSQ
jgi:hypothetical protein